MSEVLKKFGDKVRVRANGLCFKDDSILLVKHNMGDYKIWAPPGGSIQFGEPIEKAISREFREETSLDVIPGEFLFFTEFIKKPFHAVELFYSIETFSGTLRIGTEPEISTFKVIEDVNFFNIDQLKLLPVEELHSILKDIDNPVDLLKVRGHKK